MSALREPHHARRTHTQCADMSAVLKKLDEIAQRAAANHGLNIVEPISEIYGTGSFFKGVAAR